MVIEKRIQIGEAELIFRTGEYGAQADACVTVRLGDTMALCACVNGGPTDRPFMPLLVDYRERFYASGRILGSRFQRREGRPKDHEVLTSRMIDRSIRPTFPDGYLDDTMITAILLSSDGVNPSEVLAMSAATLSLSLSGVPVEMDLACACVAKVDEDYVVFPTVEQLEKASFNTTIACSREKVVMIELGGDSALETEVAEAIRRGHEACGRILDVVEEMKRELDVQRPEYVAARDDEVAQRVKGLAADRIREALDADTKENINTRLHDIEEAVVAEAIGEDAGLKGVAAQAFEKVLWEVFRRRVMEGKRDSGRGWDDLRPITGDVAVLPRSHGSGMFQRGQTQVLAATTLGGHGDRQLSEQLHGDEEAHLMLHYNFPGFSVGEVRPERGPGRRDIGHGHLALKALESVVPDEMEFPYTVRIVAEVMESCASSSMATVCASTLAMMDAGVPLRAPVAGISIGLVEMDGRYQLLNDIYYLEDAYGDMDFKVAGTREGVTAMQVDVKNRGLTLEQVAEALDLARRSRLEILDIMAGVLAEPRPELSPLAPRVGSVKIPVDKIGGLIGPGGKNVRALQEEHHCDINVEDDGTVFVSGTDAEGFEKVMAYIELMSTEPEVGATYTARVVTVKEYGAFVEFLPGVEGLLHVSEYSYDRVDRMEDVLQEGDMVEVKLMGLEREGKYRLSRKALQEKPEGYEEPKRSERSDRGDRSRGRRSGSDRGDRGQSRRR